MTRKEVMERHKLMHASVRIHCKGIRMPGLWPQPAPVLNL